MTSRWRRTSPTSSTSLGACATPSPPHAPRQQASAADLAALDLSTHAELATDYFTLRSDDAQELLLDQTVADYAQALQLTQNLYNGGAAPLSDLEQARAQLETAKTQAADIRLSRAQLEHAIAVLIGRAASTFRIDSGAAERRASRRRPSIPACPRRFWSGGRMWRAPSGASPPPTRGSASPAPPIFRSSASRRQHGDDAAGFESTSASNWITAPSRLWSVGPAGAADRVRRRSASGAIGLCARAVR